MLTSDWSILRILTSDWLIGLVKLRYIESDDNLSLRGDKLKEAIKKDRENGLIPFYVGANML